MNIEHHTRAGRRSLQIRVGLLRATLFAGLWWILADGEPTSWLVGVPTVMIATLASLWLSAPGVWSWRPKAAMRFLPFFLWHSVRGGIDVAIRAFQRHPSISPVVVKYPLRLPEGPGQILLADIVTLLPGTLTIGLNGRCLTVHVIDASLPVYDKIQAIEARIADLFALDLLGDSTKQEENID